jgi:hypothetical protein
MHLVHESAEDQAEDQEDLAVVFWALSELALNGDLTAALDDLYKKMLETPLAQNLVRHVSSTKAAFAPTKPFVGDPVRLRCIAQNLSKQVVRDCQLSPAPEIGRLADRVLPGAVEDV